MPILGTGVVALILPEGTVVGAPVSFATSPTVTFGLNGLTVTASAAGGGPGGGSVNFSAGTTSGNLASVVFSNSNGLAFGLDGSTVTGSYTTPSQTVQTQGVVRSLNGSESGISISAGNLISVSNNASTVSIINLLSSSAIAQPVSSVSAAGTLSSRYALADHAHAGLAQVSFVGNTAGQTSAGAGSIVFAGGPNVTLSGATAAGGMTVSVSAAAPGAGGAVSFSGGASSAALGSIVFSNSNGVSFGLNGSTMTGSVSARVEFSSFENIPGGVFNSSVLTFNGLSLSHAVAFGLPGDGSWSFMRLPALMTLPDTTIATMASATASASGGQSSTINAVIYSMGIGASSQSLQSVLSGQALFSFSQRISITNSTQYSISLGYSAQALGAGTSHSTQYSISNTNYSFTTNQFSAFSSNRFLDIPFAGSMSAGAYWLIAGMSSASGSGGAAGLAALTNCAVRYSAHYGASQMNLSFGVLGSTNRTSGGLMGAGSFSTAGGGTTASLPVSAVSSIASLARIYFQLLRSA